MKRIEKAHSRSRERGSALITVILVALVLTVVGLGIAYFTSTEDRISGNTKVSRIGFYAAEAGLREAEAAVTTFSSANAGNASALLVAPTDPADVYIPPGGGRPAYILKLPNRNFRYVVIATDLGDARTRAMYSVFIRNNAEDTAGGTTATRTAA